MSSEMLKIPEEPDTNLVPYYNRSDTFYYPWFVYTLSETYLVTTRVKPPGIVSQVVTQYTAGIFMLLFVVVYRMRSVRSEPASPTDDTTISSYSLPPASQIRALIMKGVNNNKCVITKRVPLEQANRF